MAFKPHRIFVDKSALRFPLTKQILGRLSDVPVEVMAQPKHLDEAIAIFRDPIGEGKRILFLTRQKGAFVKPCPCTPHYIGCNYFVINAVLNCPLDCSYCILQLYLTSPWITVYVNLEDLWKELDRVIGRGGGRFRRVGTGELGDSLALDPLLRSARDFIAYFRRRPHILFELKTKTAHVEAILRGEPAENVVLSWSLNSAEVAREEEADAPPVEERLEAAQEAVARGFPVGFHFDPLINYPGWEEGYLGVIDRLLHRIPVSRIRWVSLGCLRFPPALASVIANRFPRTKILTGELVPGRDGKLRYFKPIRLEMYRKIVCFLRRAGGKKIPLYFCMEDEEIWREVLGLSPGGKEDVERLLSPRLEAR